MKKLLVISIVLLVSLLSAKAQKNFLDVNYIEVTGRVTKEIVPDNIYLNIVINEKDNKGLDLVIMEKRMISKLSSLGIDLKKDFRIKDFSSDFQHYFLKKTDIKKIKEYELVVHTGEMAGKVFVSLEEIGIANVSVVKLRNSKIDEIKSQSKIEAIINAKEKAHALVRELGQSVGKAIYIRENREYIQYPFENRYASNRPMMAKMNFQEEEEMAPLEIEFQQITLEYSVEVRFELK